MFEITMIYISAILMRFTCCTLLVDDGRVLKALNSRAPESRDNVGQVIVSDVQVLRFGK